MSDSDDTIIDAIPSFVLNNTRLVVRWLKLLVSLMFALVMAVIGGTVTVVTFVASVRGGIEEVQKANIRHEVQITDLDTQQRAHDRLLAAHEALLRK